MDQDNDCDAAKGEQMKDHSSSLLKFILTIFMRIIHHFRISGVAASAILAFFPLVLGKCPLYMHGID
jgi:hypothetical protein